MKYKKIKMLPEKQPFLNLNILRYLKIRWRENEKMISNSAGMT